MANPTKQLWDAVDDDRTELPPVLIDAMSKALEVGLSAEQIAAVVLLAAGVYEFEAEGPVLEEKTRKTLQVMRGFRSFNLQKARNRGSSKPPGAL